MYSREYAVAIVEKFYHAFARVTWIKEVAAKENDEVVNAMIMVRPDGHIANVAWINEGECGEAMLGQIWRGIEQGLEDALGMSALGGSE